MTIFTDPYTDEDKQILESQDLLYDLMFTNYWDFAIVGNYRRLQTRQEYDKRTCEAIRNLIIHLLSGGKT